MGLSAPGVEGQREPGRDVILETLGLQVDIGWAGHHSHTKPELIGSEIAQQKFRKASAGVITLVPVARSSPDFLLPFGYYVLGKSDPKLHSIGTLALKTATRYEHTDGDYRLDYV